MADTLTTLSTVSFGLAALFLLLAVIVWIKFKIPAVIGDLTGRTARKSIARMRTENEKSGKKSYRPSAENRKRGRTTEHMEREEATASAPGTLEMAAAQNKTTPLENAGNDYGTTPLEDVTWNNVTVTLDNNPTSLLAEKNKQGAELIMLDEVIFIHTSEVI